MSDLPPITDAYTEDERALIASRLLPVAAHVICTMRDEGPDATAEIAGNLSDCDLVTLVGLLAALVPTDKSLPDLLAWTGDVWPLEAEHLPAWLVPFAADREPTASQCGTHRGFNRHKNLGEDPCESCGAGERTYQRAHKRATYAAQRTTKPVLRSVA